MTEKQLPLSGLPEASFTVRINCNACGHRVEMEVDLEVIQNLFRLRCGECGAGGKELQVTRLFEEET